MDTNRTSDRQCEMDVEPGRGPAGHRTAAAVIALGIVSMMALSGSPSATGDGAPGLQTESYWLEAPAAVEDEYRSETVAVAPATGQYEEPELTVNYEVQG